MSLNSPIIAFFIRIIFFLINGVALYCFVNQIANGVFLASFLTALSWIALHITLPTEQVRNMIRINPLTLLLIGLLLLTVLYTLPIFLNLPFFSHYSPALLKSSISYLYEICIYFILVGGLTQAAISLLPEKHHHD